MTVLRRLAVTCNILNFVTSNCDLAAFVKTVNRRKKPFCARVLAGI